MLTTDLEVGVRGRLPGEVARMGDYGKREKEL
jgi:hypothetical protein